MKKLLFFVCIITSCICMAQEQEQGAQMTPKTQETDMVSTTRIRNHYMVGTETMNKRAYRGYLQNTCPEAFAQFDKGYKTAMAGWGLFGAGPVMVGVGFPFFLGASFGYDPENTPEFERRRKATCFSCLGLTCLGGAAFVSGIVCISVGYSQMHQAADLYNNTQRSTYLTIGGQGNQLSLALHF